MTVEDFSTKNAFYCRDAGEKFLAKESVNLFIGHPPYYQAELELNGGDPTKQMQNADNMPEYYERLFKSILHMEHALTESGHIFLAFDNAPVSLGGLSAILSKTDLKLQDITLWDHSPLNRGENGTVIFAHFTKKEWYPENKMPRAPFLLTNSWKEAYDELKDYNQEYATVGAAPTGLYKEMIQNFSRKGDVVCDLFAGCGTVQIVALELGRKFIYNDVSEDKVIMARKRIKDYLTSTKRSEGYEE